jgi:glutamine amidotransferase
MTGVRLAVIDYDTGNLHSACKGLEYAGATIEIMTHPHHLGEFDGLVLPGDGAFDPAIQHLRAQGFEEPLQAAVARRQPFLGICIGLQLLFDASEEGKEPGLGIVPGIVKRFQPESGMTIPHMGWNQLTLTQPNAILWHDLPSHPWAYFVHSYYGAPADPSWIAATVTHGQQTVTAAIAKDHVMATQYHPEKSGSEGLQMIRNFVQYVAKGKASLMMHS